jgi:hypothetical protein
MPPWHELVALAARSQRLECSSVIDGALPLDPNAARQGGDATCLGRGRRRARRRRPRRARRRAWPWCSSSPAPCWPRRRTASRRPSRRHTPHRSRTGPRTRRRGLPTRPRPHPRRRSSRRDRRPRPCLRPGHPPSRFCRRSCHRRTPAPGFTSSAALAPAHAAPPRIVSPPCTRGRTH